MIHLFDSFHQKTQDLYHSLRISGDQSPTFVIEENGYLPEEIMSPYAYFADWKREGCPLYFNQVPVDEFDEIEANNLEGKVLDEGVSKGKIYFQSPGSIDRLVKEVKWHYPNTPNRPIASDYYNQYGFLYARTIYTAHGQASIKYYYRPNGQVAIIENLLVGEIILNHKEKVHIFPNKIAFLTYFLNQLTVPIDGIIYNSLSFAFLTTLEFKDQPRQDILFWQEKLPDTLELPGNMQYLLQHQTSTHKIIFQEKEDFLALQERNHPNRTRFSYMGYLFPFIRMSRYRPNILILTNSDQLLEIESIIQALPQAQFYIGALTEMSSRLLKLRKYENVHLYPNMTAQQSQKCWQICDLYLDINRGNEINQALRFAFLNHLLIFGFEETLHRPEYVPLSHRYQQAQVNQLIDQLRECISQLPIWKLRLEEQVLFAGQENPEKYHELLKKEGN